MKPVPYLEIRIKEDYSPELKDKIDRLFTNRFGYEMDIEFLRGIALNPDLLKDLDPDKVATTFYNEYEKRVTITFK